MSTLSQDLDFFDNSLYDLLALLPKDSVSSVSAYSTPEVAGEIFSGESEDTEPREGEKETFEKFEDGGCRKEIDFDDDICPENVSSTKTPDSWDLPLGPVAWDEKDKPIQQLLTYADLKLTDEEENGLLTDRIVAACSSYLTESPGNKCHIVAKVSLNNKNLNDIRILGYHRFLQYVDLSWNNLTDLTPLGCIPYLMYLDVSHNLLKEVLRFTPPMNLTFVNYSYNQVWQIDDLTDFWALCYLDLSHNKISKIQGFHNLRYLRHLDLSHNQIERFENLSNLRITDLNLEYNLISKFEMERGLGLSTMPHLANLYLNNNLISSLEFLEGAYSLKKLELQGNSISDLVELSSMKLLTNLRQLDMSGNPISEQKPYRPRVLNILQELKFLDQTEVDISERVAAGKKNRFDVQLEAARNNARMILLEQLNDTSLDLDVLPVDQGPYPFVILVGPSASYKKQIIAALGEKFSQKIYIGKLHTTRQVLDSEKVVLCQTTRQEFNEDIKAGKFLCVTENLGHFYGFSREELGMAIKEHKLCLTSMDMVGALTIHSYGIQPFLVLTLPQSEKDHKERLKVTYGPVLSLLGATYIAQRQLIDTHESNVNRVGAVLNDIITEALRKANNLVYPESLGFGSTDTVNTKTEVSENSEKERLESQSESYSDSPKEFTCYETRKRCFTCTPSKCGLQSAFIAREADENLSVLSKETKRLSASEAEIKEEVTTTSYSETEAAPVRTAYSNGGDSSYGETDAFANWSMPFVDWSEVNISGLELEQAAEVLCEKYIESVMSSRDLYQSLHLENPGLFSLCVFTDDTDRAMKDIAKFLKDVWRSTPNRRPVYDPEKDLVYQAFVPKKIESLKEMLRKDFLSADGDGIPKVKYSDAAPLNSPASICAEMRRKGYGDFSENL